MRVPSRNWARKACRPHSHCNLGALTGALNARIEAAYRYARAKLGTRTAGVLPRKRFPRCWELVVPRSSLLDEGKLGSKEIGDTRRIFLSDLEEYLGEDRAHSLVQDLGSDGPRSQEDKQVSQFERVAQKWSEIPEDEAILLSGLAKSDVQTLRNFLYRRFGKENVIVRSAKHDYGHWVTQEDGSWIWKEWKEDATFKAVVLTREGSQYLRD